MGSFRQHVTEALVGAVDEAIGLPCAVPEGLKVHASDSICAGLIAPIIINKEDEASRSLHPNPASYLRPRT